MHNSRIEQDQIAGDYDEYDLEEYSIEEATCKMCGNELETIKPPYCPHCHE